jgi:hypothetical protein
MLDNFKWKAVMLAAFDGEQIQFKTSSSPNWHDMGEVTTNPISSPLLEWRVKPVDVRKEAYDNWFDGTRDHLCRFAFNAGWDALALYLVDNGLVEFDDLPEIK